MNFLDTLIDAAEASETNHIKFLQFYKKHETSVHLFFEGNEDQSFYNNFIEHIYGPSIKKYIYIGTGKGSVYESFENINWESYNKHNVLFFTDKDFDDIIKISRATSDNIFVTKYYSIENYVVSSEIIERILREFCFVNNESILSSIKQKFDEQIIEYVRLMKIIIAWIIYCRVNKFKINLNNISLSKLFHINDNLEIKKSSSQNSIFEYLTKSTGCNNFDFIQVRNIVRNLNSIPDHKVYLRGKFEIWYLYAFYFAALNKVMPLLNSSITKQNNTSPIKKSKCKPMVPIGLDNILLLSGPRLIMPDDISRFLTFNFMKYQGVA